MPRPKAGGRAYISEEVNPAWYILIMVMFILFQLSVLILVLWSK